MKYVLFSKKEQDHCSPLLCHFCDVQSPVYPITSSKLCTVALFLKDEERFKKYCQTMSSTWIDSSSGLSGYWWSLVCCYSETADLYSGWSSEIEKIIHVNPSIGIIKMNISSTAKGDYLTLLPHYHNESMTDIQYQFVHGLSLYNGSNRETFPSKCTKFHQN